jgi:hypothetical protein
MFGGCVKHPVLGSGDIDFARLVAFHEDLLISGGHDHDQIRNSKVDFAGGSAVGIRFTEWLRDERR